MIGPGRALDPARWCIVVPNMFCNGLSSSPSNTPPPFNGPKFPAITHWDNVQAQHRLLTEKLGVRKVALATGFSMGGYLSNQIGCVNPKIRAIGPHSGGSHDLTTCPNPNKPVILMHFEGDGLIPYSCGTQARDRWLQKNGCQATAPDVTPVTGGRCEYYKGCMPGGQVAMCSFANPTGMRSEPYAGHGWSGGSKMGASGGAPFAIPETASATQLSWEFFKKFAW